MDDEATLKLAFIFVPAGAPAPADWLRQHPDAICLRCTRRPGTAPAPKAPAETVQ